MELIDTHAHLDFPRFEDDREEVINRAHKEGVKWIINAGADLASSHRGLKLSQTYSNIYSTAGIHPHDADKLDDRALKVMKDLTKTEKVVAVGEIGLDFHYDNSPRDVQKEAFRKQLDLARKIGLPVVIHSREADEETLEILKEGSVDDIGGILHCFASDREMAEKVLDMGLYIAFGGLITFKNAENLREVVSRVPLDRMLIETDAPYMTPAPYRGKRNEPAYVKHVAKKIADIKGITLKEVARCTTENAREVFNI